MALVLRRRDEPAAWRHAAVRNVRVRDDRRGAQAARARVRFPWRQLRAGAQPELAAEAGPRGAPARLRQRRGTQELALARPAAVSPQRWGRASLSLVRGRGARGAGGPPMVRAEGEEPAHHADHVLRAHAVAAGRSAHPGVDLPRAAGCGRDGRPRRLRGGARAAWVGAERRHGAAAALPASVGHGLAGAPAAAASRDAGRL
mmetsp:Transcript_74558/g.218577  ORF Transcript_74558/g.218577 Transcript_74558/m.218577 type:complete len:202 (+) Transcript_74558:70-675(+)